MKKLIGKITVFAVLTATLATGIFLVAIWTVDDALQQQSALLSTAFIDEGVTATSYVVFDQETGTVFASLKPDTVLPIASITKLFTAASLYEGGRLEATTSITWSDANTYGDAGKLYPYTVYSIRELSYPLLLESSNDAAAALLRTDPTLLERMNQTAKNSGMTATSFADTSGLSKDNVSTASELAKFSSVLFKNNPHIFNITQLSQFVGTHTGWRNNNPLVSKEGYKGGKHGYTIEAGKTTIAFFDEPLASGQTRTVGYVLLGSTNLEADITTLREQTKQKVRVE